MISKPDKLFPKKVYDRIKKENGLVSYDGTNLKDADGNNIEVGGEGETDDYYITGKLNESDEVTIYDGIDQNLYDKYGIHLNSLPKNKIFKFIGLMQGEGGSYIVNGIEVIDGIDEPKIEIYAMGVSSQVIYIFESEHDYVKRETLTETIIESSIWLSVPKSQK